MRVLAVCPGPTHTEFSGAAAHRSRALRAPTSGFMSAEAVARVAVRALARGRAVAVPGWLNRAGAWIAQLSPRAWVRRILAAAFRRMTR